MAEGEGASDGARRHRALQHRAVHGALLAAALAVATLATAAIPGEPPYEVATGEGSDRSTTTTAPPTPTTGPPSAVAVETAEAGQAPVATPGGGARAGDGGGAGRGGGGPGPAAAAPTTTATTPPPPPPPPPVLGTEPPTDACGGSVPRAGGGTWVCSWADEFEGSSIDTSKWVVFETEKTGWRNGDAPECYVNRPENVAVAGGALHLTARKEAQAFTCPHPSQGKSYVTQHTSGMISTWGRSNLHYGRVEIRAQFPNVTVPGVHSALWMWPDDPYAHWTWGLANGEIDIAEFYSRHPDRAIPYLHGPSLGAKTNDHCLLDAAGTFHTYVLEWTAERITISYDGVPCLQADGTSAFHEPFFLNLTQALGRDGKLAQLFGAQGNRYQDGVTPLPATMVVDYVRVWR